MRWKAKELNEWHAHFAWLPTKVKDEWVWMERVLRRGIGRIQPMSKDGKYAWEFVNSEFDLIKQMEEKSRYAEDKAAGQVTTPNRNMAGIAQAGSIGGLMSAAQQNMVSKAYVRDQLAMKQPPTTTGY